jgi:hypothetical protein
MPSGSGLIFPFAGSVLVCGREQRPEAACALQCGNPFLPPVCSGYSFLTEFCPGISFYSLTTGAILDPSCQRVT